MLYESAQYEPTFLWGKIECCLYRRKILQAIKKKCYKIGQIARKIKRFA